MKKGTVPACLAVAALVGALGTSPVRKPTAPRKAMPKGSTAGPIFLGTPERKYVGEPISLDLKDADLKDVLRTFGELARINVAIDPEVKGSVTVRLENVPWDQALDVILRTNGLGYVLEGKVLRIATPEKLLDPP